MEHRNVVLIKADIKKSITVAKPSRLEFQQDRPDSLGRGEEGQVGHVRASIRERSVGGLAFKEYHSGDYTKSGGIGTSLASQYKYSLIENFT